MKRIEFEAWVTRDYSFDVTTCLHFREPTKIPSKPPLGESTWASGSLGFIFERFDIPQPRLEPGQKVKVKVTIEEVI